MDELRDKPLMARPIGMPPPMAAVMAYAPIPPPVPTYPEVPMPRKGAAVDLAVMVLLLAAVQFGLGASGLGRLLIDRWKMLGIFSVNVIFGAASLLSVYVVLTLRRQPAAMIGLNRVSGLRVLVATVIAVPAAFAAGAMANLAYVAATGFDVERFMNERTGFLAAVPDIPVGFAVLFAVFVGFHEEITFRGFFLSRLRALCGSTPAAIILTSLVFGSLHAYQGWSGVFQTAAVALVLAIVAACSRTLWPTILAHACFDTIGLVLAPLAVRMMKDLQVVPVIAGWW